ncbi:uncharacterized protein LOC143031934 isoform X2 [Oratosquilla oratoria]|uniref:uncharacterized protein LOC143031934 isoform X2 n=1 Tax=Oratosquilla oratoria TaxID=337810 RepID=UPI003F75DF61
MVEKRIMLVSAGYLKRGSRMGYLCKATPEELNDVRKQLREHFPVSIVVHGYVDLLLRFDLKKLGTRVYVAKESAISSLVVVHLSDIKDGFQPLAMFFLEEEADVRELALLMGTAPDLDWNKKVLLFASPPYVRSTWLKMVTSGHLPVRVSPCLNIPPAHVYVLDPDKIPEIRVPEGMKLGSLSSHHIPTIQDMWKTSHTEGPEMFKVLITELPTAAIFLDDVDNSGDSTDTDNSASPITDRVVAWAHLYKHGAMGNTFTLPMFRRRGLASIVTIALARKVMSLDHPAYVIIRDGNHISQALHEKIGFKKTCPVQWLGLAKLGS